MIGPQILHDDDGICLHCGDGNIAVVEGLVACDNCGFDGHCHECGARIEPGWDFANACSVSCYQALYWDSL